MGDTAEQCARRLAEEGADAVGANCGSIDPRQMATVVSLLASATILPISAEPNAGLPKLRQGATVFDMGPDEFAAGLAACRQAGATVLGGCCGTTPDHIAAFAMKLRAQAGWAGPGSGPG